MKNIPVPPNQDDYICLGQYIEAQGEYLEKYYRVNNQWIPEYWKLSLSEREPYRLDKYGDHAKRRTKHFDPNNEYYCDCRSRPVVKKQTVYVPLGQ